METGLLLLSLPNGAEWIILALLILLLFGGKKIPELMKGLGKGIRNFKEGMKDVEEEIKKDTTETDKKE
jgi:sec-independent protein translocase protein TatA